MPEAVIVAATRSPIGRAFKGSMKSIRPDDLAAQVILSALSQVPQLDINDVEDLHLGCAEPWAEHGNNIARITANLMGFDQLPATTVNRFCASSTQSLRMAFHAIKSGEGDAYLAAGVECVSRYSDFAGAGSTKPEWQNPKFHDSIARTERIAKDNLPWTDPRDEGLLPDVYIQMGQTAENVANMRGISRQRQDEWGVTSHNRAERAITEGVIAKEITPITLPDGTVAEKDDGPRFGTTYEAVSQLKPVFRENGSVTAGNACPLNDGAAATVVMSESKAQELGITPLARIISTGVSALSPEIMGLGPVDACKMALSRAGMSIGDIDLYEINEAFAAQVIGSADELGMDFDKLNVNGGAIAYGHPFGATGARIMTTMLNAMRERDATIGMESMCVGGGQGMAIIVERLS